MGAVACAGVSVVVGGEVARMASGTKLTPERRLEGGVAVVEPLRREAWLWLGRRVEEVLRMLGGRLGILSGLLLDVPLNHCLSDARGCM